MAEEHCGGLAGLERFLSSSHGGFKFFECFHVRKYYGHHAKRKGRSGTVRLRELAITCIIVDDVEHMWLPGVDCVLMSLCIMHVQISTYYS